MSCLRLDLAVHASIYLHAAEATAVLLLLSCRTLYMCTARPAVSVSSPQAEDPSVKRASKHSPTALMAPASLLSPATLPPTGLNPNPLSPGGPAFLAAAAAAAAAAGSPTAMHLPGMLGPMAPLRPATFSPVTNLRDNPPCNTLFIGNLGDNTSEQELRVLMGSQPGYRYVQRWLSCAGTQRWLLHARCRLWPVPYVGACMRHPVDVGALLLLQLHVCLRAQCHRTVQCGDGQVLNGCLLAVPPVWTPCRQLKMVRGTKSTTAFVEFVDTQTAMMVHDTLQVGSLGVCTPCRAPPIYAQQASVVLCSPPAIPPAIHFTMLATRAVAFICFPTRSAAALVVLWLFAGCCAGQQ